MSRTLALILALFVSTAATAEELPAAPPQPIGRLAAISGAISYRASADAAASEAFVNYPLTTGNRIATPPRAHATVDFAAGRFYLDGDSAITVGALGPGTTAITLEQGALILHVLPGGAGQVFVIETPRGALRTDQPGYFEVEIAADSGAVIASALEGGAQFNETTVLPPGTRATVVQDSALLDSVVEDDFVHRIAAEVEASGENKLEAPKYVSPQTTGFQELQRYGLWVMTERYGWVWEPQVMSDWAPFRKGRWVGIAPWGRTWIDDAPWGFAPSHSGRWTEVNDRWVWIPDNAVPASVNGPAVVSSFGTQGPSGQGAGWVSLGPEEPVFSAQPVIVNNVRVVTKPPKIVNVTTVNNTTNVTTVVKQDRQPAGVVFFGGQNPSPIPPSPPPSASPRPNTTGLGAAGTPMGAGVPFPGMR
jgi:hypothetical protein